MWGGVVEADPCDGGVSAFGDAEAVLRWWRGWGREFDLVFGVVLPGGWSWGCVFVGVVEEYGDGCGGVEGDAEDERDDESCVGHAERYPLSVVGVCAWCFAALRLALGVLWMVLSGLLRCGLGW